MKPYYLFITALLIMCLGCKDTSEKLEATEVKQTNLDHNAELQKIEAFRQRFQLAIKEKRYGDLGPMKTDDMIGIGPASAEWLEYQREREAPMGMFSYDSISMNPKETVIMNDSMAYDYGTSKVYYTNAEGKSVELQDTYMVLLKKEDGKWKLYREIASGTVK